MKKLITLLTLMILFGCDTKITKEYIVDEKDLLPEGVLAELKVRSLAHSCESYSHKLYQDRPTSCKRQFMT